MDLAPLLARLEGFQFIDTSASASGKDEGVNVRMRSQAVLALMRDDKELRRQRRQMAESRRRAAAAGPAMIGPEASPLSSAPSPERGGEAVVGLNKGVVTAEENRNHLAALKQLLARPENRLCADCQVGRCLAWSRAIDNPEGGTDAIGKRSTITAYKMIFCPSATVSFCPHTMLTYLCSRHFWHSGFRLRRPPDLGLGQSRGLHLHEVRRHTQGAWRPRIKGGGS